MGDTWAMRKRKHNFQQLEDNYGPLSWESFFVPLLDFLPNGWPFILLLPIDGELLMADPEIVR